MKFALAATLGAAAVSAHPIQKTIDMMVDLRIQAKEEGEKEALQFQKFSHWCGKTAEEYQGKIAKNQDKIGSLESAIDGHKASIASLEDEIATLQKEIETRNADQAKATALRNEEKTIYGEKSSDLKATITAIADATAALKASKSVLQVRSIVKKAAVVAASRMSSEDSKMVHAFLQETGPAGTPNDGEVVGDAKRERARKYDFKSGSVIELLEGLHTQFKEELLETEKGENNAVNGHELAKQAQDAAIDAATKSQSEKKKILGDTESALATDEADLGDERRDLEMNQNTLKETNTECTARSNEFEQRSASREGEQAALSEAVAILAKVTGLRNPDTQEIAKRGAAEFLQLSASETPVQKEAKAKAIALINAAAAKSKDAMVQRLAQQIRVTKGPFKQIKNMIQKMIFRLNKEQQDEDAHKNWCDQELELTTQQRDDKQDQVDEMKAKIDALTADITDLATALAEAEASIADTQQYMKDEMELRADNKADNTQTIADAKEAQAALAQAIGVLTKFYKESGAIAKESWEELVQVGSKPGAGFEAEATFMNTSGSDKVMNLLETCLSDYSSMEAEAVAAEEADEAAYAEDMAENKVNLAKLRNEVKVKTARKTTKEQEKADMAGQHKKSTKQLEALKQYLSDLQQPCVEGDSSYEDRKGARATEIEGLKEALNVLADAFKPKSFLAVH